MAKLSINLARRKFMVTAGCAGVAGAAAAWLWRPTATGPAPGAAPADPAGARGYHETAHIRKYYHSARLF